MRFFCIICSTLRLFVHYLFDLAVIFLFWPPTKDQRQKTKDQRPKTKDQKTADKIQKTKDQRPRTTRPNGPTTKDKRPRTKDQRPQREGGGRACAPPLFCLTNDPSMIPRWAQPHQLVNVCSCFGSSNSDTRICLRICTPDLGMAPKRKAVASDLPRKRRRVTERANLGPPPAEPVPLPTYPLPWRMPPTRRIGETIYHVAALRPDCIADQLLLKLETQAFNARGHSL